MHRSTIKLFIIVVHIITLFTPSKRNKNYYQLTSTKSIALNYVAIETKPQMLTRSNAGNERNFASALLSTNEISKCSTKLRNTQRNFETLNETSLENSLHQTKYRSKFRAMFRAITRNFEHVKTIALRNFFEISFEISLVFAYIRRNSTKFVEIRSYYFCTVLYNIKLKLKYISHI